MSLKSNTYDNYNNFLRSYCHIVFIIVKRKEIISSKNIELGVFPQYNVELLWPWVAYKQLLNI